MPNSGFRSKFSTILPSRVAMPHPIYLTPKRVPLLEQVLRRVLICAMFVVGIPPLAASEAHSFSEFNHMSWTGREGAPSGISYLIQTKDRYLWMGTPLGLYRYDGLRFASYPFTPLDPPLPSSDISALAADPSGGLWVGYRLGGITRLKDGRAIHYGQKNGLLGNSTSQLLCQQDGSVWAIADGHLMHLNGERWENFGAQHGLSSNGLFTIFFDKSGNIWSAAKFNVFLLRKGAEHFETFAATTFAVTQFAQAPDGAIWVSDGWKSVRPLLPSAKAQPIQLPGTAIILLDSDGMFWIAEDYRGVARVRANISTRRDPASIESFTASDGLTSQETRAILKDDEGNIWVGTARGLDRFQRSSFTRFHYRTVESFPSLAAATDGTVWLGLWGSPLLALRNGQVTPGVTVPCSRQHLLLLRSLDRSLRTYLMHQSSGS
ncbi:MAG: Adenylate cyclase [Edaphobacter sp.]|nr:Adenylate cyclase [Edaphobacter sp.]